jgi:hypothetical protein
MSEDNRIQNTQYLIDRDIHFTSKNNGQHLIVEGNNELIDFYPSTSKWIKRTPSDVTNYIGVQSLVKHITWERETISRIRTEFDQHKLDWKYAVANDLTTQSYNEFLQDIAEKEGWEK